MLVALSISLDFGLSKEQFCLKKMICKEILVIRRGNPHHKMKKAKSLSPSLQADQESLKYLRHFTACRRSNQNLFFQVALSCTAREEGAS